MFRRLNYLALFVPAAIAALAAIGCRDDEIRHYTVKPIDPPKLRLLAVILPVREKVWFVNVTGPEKSVADLKPQFDQFVQSIRFPENERRRVTWELPEGWKKEPNRSRLVYATFRAGQYSLEVRIAQAGGDQLSNVNRWRGQLGLNPITQKELPEVATPLSVNGISATAVDMTSSGTAGARPMEPETPTIPPTPTDVVPQFDVPEGWEKLPIARGSMRVASFRITDGDRSADVSVIPLAGPAGGLLANVNRWRGEVGLPDITEKEMQKDAKMINARAGAVVYVDLLGPETAGPKRERTLGGILLHGGQSWFFKLRGPADLVAKQVGAFEKFLQSLRFAEAPGDK